MYIYKENKPRLLDRNISILLVKVHPRNICAKSFSNWASSHYIHIRKASPATWRPCISRNLNNINNLGRGLP